MTASLERLREELDRQDEQLRRAREVLARTEDATFSRSVVDEVEEIYARIPTRASSTPSIPFIRA